MMYAVQFISVGGCDLRTLLLYVPFKRCLLQSQAIKDKIESSGQSHSQIFISEKGNNLLNWSLHHFEFSIGNGD